MAARMAAMDNQQSGQRGGGTGREIPSDTANLRTDPALAGLIDF